MTSLRPFTDLVFFVSSTETSDDILAKYRKPKPAETGDQPANQRQPRLPSATDDDDDSLAYDPLNLETCKAFVDAKKKLRLVLSTLDPQMVPMMHGVTPQRTHHHRDNELIAFLQILLAEALNLQDHDAIAQLHETIRCLRQFESHEYVMTKCCFYQFVIPLLSCNCQIIIIKVV